MSELVLKGLGIERVDDLGAKKAELAFLFGQGEHSSFEFYMEVFLGLGSTRFDKYVKCTHLMWDSPDLLKPHMHCS